MYLHLLLGVGICWSLYYLMRTCRVSRWLAFALAAWFIVSPGVILFENYLLYEYLVAFLLLTAAVALARFFEDARARWMILFFTALFALVLVRNFFHLVCFIAILAALAFLSKSQRRMVLLCGALPLCSAIIGLYAKNRILFGTFSGSTWMGMEYGRHHGPSIDLVMKARDFVRRGVISGASLLDLGSAIGSAGTGLTFKCLGAPGSRYWLTIALLPLAATNFNCLAFLQVQQIYTRDGLALLRKLSGGLYALGGSGLVQLFFAARGLSLLRSQSAQDSHPRSCIWNFVFFGPIQGSE